MPFSGCTPSASPARARYRTLLSAMFCMACALFAGIGSLAAQGVDVSSGTRLESVMASIRARDPLAGPDLSARFDTEPQAGIRAWIVRGLVVLKAPQGPSLFKAALRDSSPLVRQAAVEALAQTQGVAAVPDLAAALAAESNAGVRNSIVFWLGSFKTTASATALQGALSGDADANVRVQAARSLKRQGTSGAKKHLKGGKSDRDARVRAIANEP